MMGASRLYAIACRRTAENSRAFTMLDKEQPRSVAASTVNSDPLRRLNSGRTYAMPPA